MQIRVEFLLFTTDSVSIHQALIKDEADRTIRVPGQTGMTSMPWLHNFYEIFITH